MGWSHRGRPFAIAVDRLRGRRDGARGTAGDVAGRRRRYEHLYSRHNARAAARHRLGRRPGGDRDRGGRRVDDGVVACRTCGRGRDVPETRAARCPARDRSAPLGQGADRLSRARSERPQLRRGRA